MPISELAHLATVLATGLAAAGLFLTSCALRQQTRSADLASLLTFVDKVRDAETRLSSGEERDQEIINYLNLLEAYAAAVNRRLLGRAALAIAKERIINDIAILSLLAPDHFKRALTSPETFNEIVTFHDGNRDEINNAKERERQRRTNQ